MSDRRTSVHKEICRRARLEARRGIIRDIMARLDEPPPHDIAADDQARDAFVSELKRIAGSLNYKTKRSDRPFSRV